MKLSVFLLSDAIEGSYKEEISTLIKKHSLSVLGAIVVCAAFYIIAVFVVISSSGIATDYLDKFFLGDWNVRVGIIGDFFRTNVYVNTTFFTFYVLLTVQYAKTSFLEKQYWHLRRAGILLTIPVAEWDETPKLNIPDTKLIEAARDNVRLFLNSRINDYVRVKIASGHDCFGPDGFLNDIVSKPNIAWRILILDPESAGAENRKNAYSSARAVEPIEDPHDYCNKIKAVIDNLKKIKHEFNPNISVRAYQHTPQWRIIMSSGNSIISGFGPGQRSDRTPLVMVENSSTSLFHGFEEMFEDIWHNDSKIIL